MDIAQQERDQRNITKARAYENLWLNDDFQTYKKEQFDDVLAKQIEVVMFSDPLDEHSLKDVQRNILKFQALVYAIQDSFNQKIDAAAISRKNLKMLQRNPFERSTHD